MRDLNEASRTRRHAAQAVLAAPVAHLGLALPRAAEDLQADPFAPMLQAAAAASPASTGTAPGPLRRRLFERVARSAAASRSVHTRHHADTVSLPVPWAAGVTVRRLYEATSNAARRPGEPDAVMLIELAPGATWSLGSMGSTLPPAHAESAPATRPARPAHPTRPQREWLVLRGRLDIGNTRLGAHDYHVVPVGTAPVTLHSAEGALLYLRETTPDGTAAAASPPPQATWTQRADTALWADHAPGIKRRLMWQQGGQAAMLYHALPGAAVPHHGHRHDEECLMLAGDFFLDEVLLQSLDYQIAPAGSEHLSSSTDTGVLLFAHGDVDLDLK